MTTETRSIGRSRDERALIMVFVRSLHERATDGGFYE